MLRRIGDVVNVNWDVDWDKWDVGKHTFVPWVEPEWADPFRKDKIVVHHVEPEAGKTDKAIKIAQLLIKKELVILDTIDEFVDFVNELKKVI